MNHLGIDGTGRVVFDAGDAVVAEEDEDEDIEMEDTYVDVSALRDFLPTEERAAELTISELLGGFRFSSNPDDMPDLAAITGLSSFAEEDREPSVAPQDGEVEDFFGDEDYDAGPSNFNDAYDGDDGFVDDVFGAHSGSGAAPPDGRRGQDLFMPFAEGDDDGGMYDYFDRGFGKGWAGAEHWKLRKVSRKGGHSVTGIFADSRSCGGNDKGEARAQSSVHYRLHIS